jgi:predicted TIM-barrel fold metal-dependent hydrolase
MLAIEAISILYRNKGKVMKVDIHTHYLCQPNFEIEFLKEMDKANVDFSVVHAIHSEQDMKCCLGNNDDVFHFMKKHPDRIIGSIYVDPRNADWKSIIDKYYSLGFKCIKMFPPAGFYPDEERFSEVFEYINQLKLPVLFHMGLTDCGAELNSKYANPLRIDGLIRRFPAISYILAHWGGRGFIHEAWALHGISPNVYIDTSGGDWGWPGVGYYKLITETSPIDFGRIAWGTDNILPPTDGIKELDAILQAIDKSDFKDEVFGETAKKIFNIVG